MARPRRIILDIAFCRVDGVRIRTEQEMFGDRGPSIFPHPVSAWWIPILLGLGWCPLLVADVFAHDNFNAGEGFAMPWGMGVALPCSVLAALSVCVQAFRFLMYVLNRPKPMAK